MSTPQILVAGIGNIFLGDDAFGVEVAQRLARRALPDGLRVVDFGIRGIDLAYALLKDYEAVIFVDAAPRGGEPGTLYVIEPKLEVAAQDPTTAEQPPVIDMHSLEPMKVLRLTQALGGRIDRVLVVGCEPLTTGADEQTPIGLSEPVEAAVDEAVDLIETLVARLIASPQQQTANHRQENQTWLPA